MNKLITSELSNKLFLRNLKKGRLKLELNQNFKIESSKDFKMIKKIIAIELFAGQRPCVVASYVKKSLIINLRITKSDLPEILPILQKSPVIWKNYLSNLSIYEKGFYSPSMIKTQDNLIIKFNKLTRLNNWVKSAYLD